MNKKIESILVLSVLLLASCAEDEPHRTTARRIPTVAW